MNRIIWVTFAALLCMSELVIAQEFDHDIWNTLLNEHVNWQQDGHNSTVDYDSFKSDQSKLHSYLDKIAEVEQITFKQWDEPEQLAFLINAYNAWTIQLIISEWPNLESIKDLGSWFKSPWAKPVARLFQQSVSLDHIEHSLIRSEQYSEPRIHFAVNCASVGCPALRPEAYIGDALSKQLDNQTLRFLGDQSRNNINGDVLSISPIFKWYREDFEKGWSGINSRMEFIQKYAQVFALSNVQQQALRQKKLKIRYTEYDWQLNSASSL